MANIGDVRSSWLTRGTCRFFSSWALQTKLRLVRRRAAAQTPLFNMVRVEFYYFYLTPAPGNLYSTISRTLNSFWACFYVGERRFIAFMFCPPKSVV